jgi:hypothetical protein
LPRARVTSSTRPYPKRAVNRAPNQAPANEPMPPLVNTAPMATGLR